MTEVQMHLSRLRYGLTISCILTFALCLTACGGAQQQPQATAKGKDSFACGDQTVGVVPVDGTSPKDVYLCKGDTLTWIPNGHTFVVTFPKKYPFAGPPKTFTNDPQKPNDPVVSPPAIYTGSLVVYHYDMMVDNVTVSDPQVVGGGGHSNY
jgi:hypothetical protein